jgi:hemerythrin superfamily protein
VPLLRWLGILALVLTLLAAALAATGAGSALEAAFDALTAVMFALVISAILYLLFEVQRRHRADRLFSGHRLARFVRRLSREEIGADHADEQRDPPYFEMSMDAIELLIKQHQGAKKGMEAVAQSSGAEKKRLFEALRADLLAHDHLEEEVFYPSVQAFPKAATLALKDKEAHATVEKALARLSALSVDDAAWAPLFRSMQERLLKHVAEEEEHFFVRIRQLLSAAQMAELTVRMKAPAVPAARA